MKFLMVALIVSVVGFTVGMVIGLTEKPIPGIRENVTIVGNNVLESE